MIKNKKRYQAIGNVYQLSEEKFLEFFQKAFNGIRLSRAFVTHRERKSYHITTDQTEDNHFPKGTVVFNDECTITLPNISGKELYSFLANQETIEDDLLGKYEISTFTTYQSIVIDNTRLRTSPVVFDSRTEKDWSPYTAEGREKIYEKIKSVLNEEDAFIVISSLPNKIVYQSDTPIISRSYKSTLISDSDNEINFNFSFKSDYILKLTTIFEVDDDFKYNKDQLKAIGKGKLEDLSSRFVKDLDIDIVDIREDGDFID